ncbi:hypothetical protein JCM21900_001891 [Sporobolomyces salmonicolor]
MLRSPAAEFARICPTLPTLRRLQSRRPLTTRTLSSTGSTSSYSFPSRRNVAIGATALALAGTAYLASPSFDEAPLLPPSLNRNDPLSVLDPAILAHTNLHLTRQSLPNLVREWVVFAVSEQSALVEAGPWIIRKIQWTKDNVPLLGPAVWAVFVFGMNNTFYKVYAGGESVTGCAEVVKEFADKGVGVIFNYSAEAPLGAFKPASGIDHASMSEIHHAVIEAAKLSTSTSSAASALIKPSLLAIKLTGLVHDTSLLARASSVLTSNSTFQRGGRLAVDPTRPFPDSPELSEEDHELLAKLYEGLRKVCCEAKKQGVRLLVDAEQSWFQPAIDLYAELLSEEFNKVDPSSSTSGPAMPIVYNTYQCYLRTTPSKLQSALAHASSNNYSFGAKLVRGAYVESERERHAASSSSAADGEPCLVWGSKAETDECYDECAELLEKRIAEDLKDDRAEARPGAGVCLASHNGTSMKRFLEKLRADGLLTELEDGTLEVDERLRGRVALGQLMGMSDNLTQTLVSLLPPPPPSSVPLVVKYTPYATLEQGLPYLVRRANENQSILKGDPTSGRGGAADERRAVGRELRRRLGLSF